VSQQLENNFTNAALHEQAAVLLGAFAMREHSGDFYDIRSPLCRMTTHLAMARFLSGDQPPGINGRIAEAMLLLLMNNEAAVVEQLNGIPAGDKALEAWVKTLRAEATADYRIFADPTNVYPIERIAWFRSFVKSVDTDLAWNKLAAKEKSAPGFARIANESYYSVETGHELLAASVGAEIGEIAAVHNLAREKKLDQKSIVTEMNALPGRCFAMNATNGANVAIIGWGQWAMFFQRQLGHAIEHNFDFIKNKYGVPEEAKDFSEKCEKAFGGLRLYPFVRRYVCTDRESYHKATDDSFKVTVETPQLTPAECWNELCYAGPNHENYNPNPNPHINEWHKHNPPPGTAYNPLPRFNHPSLVGRPDAITLVEGLHATAPYDEDISFNLIRMKFRDKKQALTYDQAREIYKMVLPYATYAMSTVADTVQDRPDQYELLCSNAAVMDPSRFFLLGEYFETNHMDEKAARYFEKGNQLCGDSVTAASHAPWLVAYYLKKGQTGKAQTVADWAGETYSGRGLEAKAQFLEATGKYTEAFEWYARKEERYKDSGSLISFCRRYKAKTGNTRFDAELNRRIAEQFPKGMEQVSLKDFNSPPVDGVMVKDQNELSRSAGLGIGDVIVALNGIRTRNLAQYLAIRGSLTVPEMTMIVWQGKQYKQLVASPPEHKFNILIVDYPEK
jgi:hypothetical protein